MKNVTALDLDHRINLRLPADTFDAIDHLRCDTIAKVSRNTWIAQAILEKIQRDQVCHPTVSRPAGNGRHFFEFFAGGGMARAGLGEGWHCAFANDNDAMKGRVYNKNWGPGDLLVEDVGKLTLSDLPGKADLVWASFPCQDLSLAGNYEGIGHWSSKEPTRSGTFWPFWRLMRELIADGRAPKTIVLENVFGILTSNGARDFGAIVSALSTAGYRLGAVVVDARLFVPQSRPRVFVVAVRADLRIPKMMVGSQPSDPWHPAAMLRAHAGLSNEARKRWVWWKMTTPAVRHSVFADLVEENPGGVVWHTKAQTDALLAMMTPLNRKKVSQAMKSRSLMVGAVYRRTRPDGSGNKVQRAEVRFDDVAGCLRTPAGGSSRQMLLLVKGPVVRSRLLSPREAARLMGLPDAYQLPENYNDAYHVAGDGVAIPVVRHLASELLEPLLEANSGVVEFKSKVA